MIMDGYPIVLTSDLALMSDYNNSTTMGFASAVPANFMPEKIAKKLFPVESDENGRMIRAQYGLCSVR